jgi:hypothetical protein
LEAQRFLDRKTPNTSSAKATSPSASSVEVHIPLIEPTGTPARPVRVAEIDQHPITHVFRYEPTEALHSVGDALLVGRNDLAKVFRVHARR